eukprot:CAMPEP_0194033716 /NCGR_PEP_ID=MMETSP0009_2-20130614/6282_1 /TAXON_ID=210454 /ORGANISM="Grammatophora oceanica, Strain CCMP 410" /LENGTH=827 /DNA_ID=CAMNT_0038674433 /DNA_START=279 /DNA_END=2762 /DNA_ORIENTATION=-
MVLLDIHKKGKLSGLQRNNHVGNGLFGRMKKRISARRINAHHPLVDEEEERSVVADYSSTNESFFSEDTDKSCISGCSSGGSSPIRKLAGKSKLKQLQQSDTRRTKTTTTSKRSFHQQQQENVPEDIVAPQFHAPELSFFTTRNSQPLKDEDFMRTTSPTTTTPKRTTTTTTASPLHLVMKDPKPEKRSDSGDDSTDDDNTNNNNDDGNRSQDDASRLQADDRAEYVFSGSSQDTEEPSIVVKSSPSSSAVPPSSPSSSRRLRRSSRKKNANKYVETLGSYSSNGTVTIVVHHNDSVSRIMAVTPSSSARDPDAGSTSGTTQREDPSPTQTNSRDIVVVTAADASDSINREAGDSNDEYDYDREQQAVSPSATEEAITSPPRNVRVSSAEEGELFPGENNNTTPRDTGAIFGRGTLVVVTNNNMMTTQAKSPASGEEKVDDNDNLLYSLAPPPTDNILQTTMRCDLSIPSLEADASALTNPTFATFDGSSVFSNVDSTPTRASENNDDQELQQQRQDGTETPPTNERDGAKVPVESIIEAMTPATEAMTPSSNNGGEFEFRTMDPDEVSSIANDPFSVNETEDDVAAGGGAAVAMRKNSFVVFESRNFPSTSSIQEDPYDEVEEEEDDLLEQNSTWSPLQVLEAQMHEFATAPTQGLCGAMDVGNYFVPSSPKKTTKKAKRLIVDDLSMESREPLHSSEQPSLFQTIFPGPVPTIPSMIEEEPEEVVMVVDEAVVEPSFSCDGKPASPKRSVSMIGYMLGDYEIPSMSSYGSSPCRQPSGEPEVTEDDDDGDDGIVVAEEAVGDDDEEDENDGPGGLFSGAQMPGYF